MCDACEHTFVAECPTHADLQSHYASYKYEKNDLSTVEPFLFTILGEVVKGFDPYRSTGRFMDVGFGSGGFLSVAKSRGWETWGVESAEAAVDKAREHRLGHVLLGDFTTLPLDEGTFDVVVMSEFVEHLPTPAPFLERALRVLRPGGLLYITTPHGRGLSGRLLRAAWSVLRPPDHLHLFSQASLRRALNEAGFSEVRLHTQGLFPHELMARAKDRLRIDALRGVARPKKYTQRTTKAYALNRALTTRSSGKAVKATMNAILRATKLGDSLRGFAIR